jgi:hypothetical protein
LLLGLVVVPVWAADEPRPPLVVESVSGRTVDGPYQGLVAEVDIIVVDGRAPQWSVGVTLPELADLMIERGAYDAINLDGGGSSSFVYRWSPVQPGATWTNRPSDGRFRPVANHLGVRVADAANELDQTR